MVLLSTSEFTPPRYPSSNGRWTRIVRKSLIEGPRDVLKPLARTRENTPKNPLPLLWNPRLFVHFSVIKFMANEEISKVGLIF